MSGTPLIHTRGPLPASSAGDSHVLPVVMAHVTVCNREPRSVTRALLQDPPTVYSCFGRGQAGHPLIREVAAGAPPPVESMAVCTWAGY